MPQLRIKISQGLVGHLIELRVELDDLAIWIAVISEDIVSRPVASWSPDQRKPPPTEQVACALDMSNVRQLEGDVMHSLIGITQKVHGMVIRPAAEEGEEVADPIGFPEIQKVTEEFCRSFDVGYLEGDVTQTEWTYRLLRFLEWRHRGFSLNVNRKVTRSLKTDALRNRGSRVGRVRNRNSARRQPLPQSDQVFVGRYLETKPRAICSVSLLQNNRVVIQRTSEKHCFLGVSLDAQPEHLLIVF